MWFQTSLEMKVEDVRWSWERWEVELELHLNTITLLNTVNKHTGGTDYTL